MNLSTTISLLAGGPGSGCNPEKGKCGRRKSAITYNPIPDDETRGWERDGFVTRKEIPISSIIRNPAQALSNVDTFRVTALANQMRMGKSFSPILLFKTQDGYMISDGTHRFAAIRRVFKGIKTISAYVLTRKGMKKWFSKYGDPAKRSTWEKMDEDV